MGLFLVRCFSALRAWNSVAAHQTCVQNAEMHRTATPEELLPCASRKRSLVTQAPVTLAPCCAHARLLRTRCSMRKETCATHCVQTIGNAHPAASLRRCWSPHPTVARDPLCPARTSSTVDHALSSPTPRHTYPGHSHCPPHHVPACETACLEIEKVGVEPRRGSQASLWLCHHLCHHLQLNHQDPSPEPPTPRMTLHTCSRSFVGGGRCVEPTRKKPKPGGQRHSHTQLSPLAHVGNTSFARAPWPLARPSRHDVPAGRQERAHPARPAQAARQQALRRLRHAGARRAMERWAGKGALAPATPAARPPFARDAWLWVWVGAWMACSVLVGAHGARQGGVPLCRLIGRF